MTLEQFKKGIARHSKILRTHGLIDPADRQDKGFRRYDGKMRKRHWVYKTPHKKAAKVDLLEELFSE